MGRIRHARRGARDVAARLTWPVVAGWRSARHQPRTLILVAIPAILAAACSNSESTTRPGSPAPTMSTTSLGAAPVFGHTGTVAGGPESGFTGTVAAVTAADLGSSWRPGCPVAPADLRILRVSHWGFDDQPHQGSIVVAASVTEPVLDVFRTLYDQRFPIRRMDPVDTFGGDDNASMAADNTSGFNCRLAVTDGPPSWSSHAYGLAIDVNPVENPYVLGGQVLPPAGATYTDRSDYRPGMAGDGPLTAAFAAVGWSWGGVWADYQHFSANGG